MKSLLIYIFLAVLLVSCHRAPVSKRKTDWKLYHKAYDLLNTNPDSAFYYFNQIAVQSHDSLQIAMSYNIMGQIQYRAGDFFGSQESLLTSLKFLREDVKKQHYYIASDYNDLGLVRSELKDSDGALDFYQKSLRLDTDSALLNQTWNNMAYEWQRIKRYDKAIPLYRKLLAKIKTKNVDYARALTNLVVTRWLYDQRFNAGTPLREALDIRKKFNDRWGQNSSYAHLSDYYRRSMPDSALRFAKAMYQVSRELNSADDQLEALGKLTDLTPPVKAKIYFDRFRNLNDSLQTARNAAKNQFALIRYNVERARVENLKLQKENADKKLQLIRERIVLYSAVLTFLLSVISAILWYRKRQRQQEIDKLNAIAETNHKASKKVHDTLANDTYRIMKTVQRDLIPDKEWLVYHIHDLYVRTRDISYELTEAQQTDYQLKISDLLKSFGDDHTRVSVVGNKKEFWDKINQAQRFEIKYVLQELMVNMQKHSRASNVTIKFAMENDHVMITYYDNGVGFKNTHQPKNGLTNTGNRIKEIGGAITFDSDEGKGLLIRITLPIIKYN